MRLSDVFKGKSGREISGLIADTVVVGVVEISGPSEVSQKVEEVRKALRLSTSSNNLILVLKN